jgi:hypothetical protein
MSGPLEGIRVLDLTSVVMGPYATQILGDYGADVIKIEPPMGDVMRQSGPMKSPNMGHFYLTTNRNKRSLVLDLKKEKAKINIIRDKINVKIVSLLPSKLFFLIIFREIIEEMKLVRDNNETAIKYINFCVSEGL